MGIGVGHSLGYWDDLVVVDNLADVGSSVAVVAAIGSLVSVGS
jgi:hypothetical protein